MYQWLGEFIADAKQYCEFAPGTDAARIAEMEMRLGTALPPSYRAFLVRWDGASVCSERIFSCTELLEYAENECGFAPYRGELRLTADSGQNYRRIYGLKPTHFLAFGSPDLSADLYCLDTQRSVNGEYLVCEFSHDDDDLKRLMRPECPSFEALLLEKLYNGIGLTDVFLDDSLEEDEAERYFEEKSAYWGERLHQMLSAAGADMEALPHLRWAAWRRAIQAGRIGL
jgi:hypothetical protein